MITETTRKQIHELLDRVLAADLQPWPRFRLTCKSDGTMLIAITIGGVSIEQEVSAGNEQEAVVRALEATAP